MVSRPVSLTPEPQSLKRSSLTTLKSENHNQNHSSDNFKQEGQHLESRV